MFKSVLRLTIFAVAVVSTLAAVLVVIQHTGGRTAMALPPASDTASATLPASRTPAPTPTPFIFPTQPASPTATASATATQPTHTASPMPTQTLTPLPTATNTPESVSYTVIISNTFARSEPDVQSSQYRQLAKGQTYTVTAESPDGIWLQIDVPEAKAASWVPAAFGSLQGPRGNLPQAGPTPASIFKTAMTVVEAAPSYPYQPVVSAHSLDIYRYGLLLGNNPHAFIKIGDCLATTPYFLAALDNAKSYRLGQTYAYLQDTIQQFAGSFARVSVAAQIGFGSTSVLDPTWADPNQCYPGESPLVCEYRIMRPSLALISLGTNDTWQSDGRNEKDLRRIIEYLTHQGVLPILSTKADNVEGDGRFNKLMVQLAAEYDIPLWDFWSVTRDIPGNGIIDSYHLSWGPAIFDDPKNLQLGWPRRNLTALQALDTVWRSVR